MPFDFGEEAINSDEMVSVFCTVNKGDFPIDIYWLLNNKSISTVHGVNVLRTNKRISQLTIDSVQEEHAGVYSCLAKNSAGIASWSTVLKVNGTCTNFIIPFIIPPDPN